MKKASELASWGFIFRCEDYGLDTTIDMQARCIACVFVWSYQDDLPKQKDKLSAQDLGPKVT